MAIKGFDKAYYLSAKLDQLQNDPATAAEWAGKDAAFLEEKLINGFGLTAESHYEQYGYQEGLAPNAFFDSAEYIRAKAVQMVNDTSTSYTNVAEAEAAFVEIWGGNVYLHYLEFGEKENVNPSNDFDVSSYLDAKLAALQADPDTAEEWADKTTADLTATFETANLTALEHFLAYGQDEGLEAPAVPADERVEVDAQNPGQVFSLTTGIDTETGTADDDTFQANVENLAGVLTQTLQAGDLIDGGEGNDTLSAVLNANAGAVTISNVENLELRSIDGAAALDMANTNAAENVTVANSVDAIALSNAGGVSNFNVNNQSSAVNVTGSTATSLNLGFSNFGTAAAAGVFNINDVATSADVTLANSNASITTAASLTDLSVEATGDNALLTASLGAVETIDVTGAGSVEFGGGSYTALETLTSSAEGGVTVTAANTLTSATLGAGDDDLTVTNALTSDTVYNLGAGDDRLELQAAPAAGATLNGGEGEDTIALAKANFTTVAGYTAAQRGLISNFEVLELTDALADTDAFDVSVIDGVTSFVAGEGVATAGTATVNGVTSGSTVGLAGDTANDGELVVNVNDAATGTADELNVALDKDISNGDGATAAASTVGAAGVETVNVDSSFNATDTLAAADVLTNTLTLNNDDLVTLNVAGDAALTFVAAATMEDLETINASDNTAGVDITVNAALTQTVTITGTAEDDTIVLSANDVVDAGAGDDAITLANLAQVTGGAGEDTFTMTASASQVSYASILDYSTSDDTIAATAGATFNDTQITLAANAVFSDYVEAASAGTVGNELSWFQFDGNTYVVNDQSIEANFVNGTDMIVELVGQHDLSDATLNAAGELSFA